MKRDIVTIITSATGERVIVCRDELDHAMRHFILPEDIFLELLERVLKDPSEVYIDSTEKMKEYRFFYKIIQERYILVIIKIISEGAFFSSMYTTGSSIRNTHKKFIKIKL